MFKRIGLLVIITILALTGITCAEPGPGPGAPIGGMSNTFTGSFFDFNSAVRLRTHLGAELVTNGTFTGSSTGWTLGTGWAYSANAVVKNADGTGQLSQAFSVVANAIYVLVFTLSNVTVGSLENIDLDVVTKNVNLDWADTFEIVFAPTASGSVGIVFSPTDLSRFTIDNVSVKKVGNRIADSVTLWTSDLAGTAGQGALHILGEDSGNAAIVLGKQFVFGDSIKNTKGLRGLTINQLTLDDEIFTGKSTDIQHSFTTNTESNSYYFLKKLSATAGGLDQTALSAGDATAFSLTMAMGTTNPTDTTPAGILNCGKLSGTTIGAIGDAETCFQIQNNGTALETTLGNGDKGIGTTAPGAKLDVAEGVMAMIVGADNGVSNTRTDAVAKRGRIGGYQFNTAEEPAGIIYYAGDSNDNYVYIGGGDSAFNAATQIGFFTAANRTTTTGTERMHIDSGGNVGINTTSFGTTLANGLAMGNGTAATAALANGWQVWSADFLGGAGDARMHIMGEGSAAALTILGSGKVTVQGTTGGVTKQIAEATATLSGASTTIQTNVTSGSRIIAVQLRVDTTITSGDGATSWTAAFVNVPTTAITSGQAFAQNTKFSKMTADEIATGEVDITITPNANTFSGGVIRAIITYELYDAMASL